MLTLATQRSQPDVPLTAFQKRMARLNRFMPQADTLARAFLLRGKLDRQALTEAVAWSAGRGPVLSSVIVEQDGDLWRRQGDPVRLQVHPVRAGEESAAMALNALQEETAKPFDLYRGPLLRVMLFPIASDEHLFLFHAHHIVVDGYSIVLGLKFVLEAYVALINGGTPAVHEADDGLARIAQREAAYCQSGNGVRDAAYWGARVERAGSQKDRGERPPMSLHSSVLGARLDGKERELIVRAAEKAEATSAGLYAAAFQQVLETVQPGSALSTTFSLRQTPSLLRVLGPLFSYGLLAESDTDESFAARACRLSDEIKLGQVHAGCAETIGPHGPDPDALPLERTALISFHVQSRFGNLALGSGGAAAEVLPGLMMENIALPTRLVPYGLFLSVGLLKEEFSMLLVYNRTLYAQPDAQAILDEVRRVLQDSAHQLLSEQP
jgi:Condensation domain